MTTTNSDTSLTVYIDGKRVDEVLSSTFRNTHHNTRNTRADEAGHSRMRDCGPDEHPLGSEAWCHDRQAQVRDTHGAKLDAWEARHAEILDRIKAAHEAIAPAALALALDAAQAGWLPPSRAGALRAFQAAVAEEVAAIDEEGNLVAAWPEVQA